MIARQLPDGAGRALVLATAGVRLLAEAGIIASTGKDIGKMDGTRWTAPISWKHNVIAAGILVNLATSGWDVFPEATIRRRGEKLAKIPDGLAVLGEKVLWLEVEQARKTGPSMRLLGQALVSVSESLIEPVCGYRANIACCAYVIDAKDENGHRLSHQLRVRSAIEKEAKKDVNITWIACTVRRNGLVDMKTSAEIVEASLPSRILARLNGIGWTFANEQWVVQYGHHNVSIWSGEDEGSDEILWYFKVDESESGWAESLTAAKRAAAAVLGSLPTV